MTLTDLAWALEDVRKRAEPYALFRAYDRGDHRLLFATDKFLNAFGSLFREFADNMCDDVVDALTDRLQINGLASKDGAPEPDPENPDAPPGVDALGEMAAEWWETVNGESRLGGVHRNGVREGDGFLLVQQGMDGVAQPWKQRPERMAVRYSQDTPDQIELAAKVWRDGKRWRANLFYPDGLVERYGTQGLSSNGAMPQFRAFRPLSAQDAHVMAAGAESYQDDSGEGMPVFHYPNGEVSEYGVSVVGKIIPMQDALNKSVADMLVAMEYHAYPQRWATGVQVEYNPVTGEERQPFEAGEGRVWRVGAKDAALGQFDPAGMEGFLKVQDSFRLEIGRKGSLAPHALNLQSQQGTPPTGISLLVTEGRTIKWAGDRQRDWGATDRRMAAYCLNMTTPGLGVDSRDLAVNWAPAATRDMLALLEELAGKVDLGLPKRQALIEAGYDAQDVDKWLADKANESETDRLVAETLAGGRVAVDARSARDLAEGLPPAPVA